MSISMNLWAIENGGLKEIDKSRINLERQLEDWIFADPSILDLDVLILGRQIKTGFGGIIDLLAINREGDLVVIELKRDKTPRDVVAQCLDYAAWVSNLVYEEIVDIYLDSASKQLSHAFNEYFDEPLPENINQNHQLIIAAASLDDSTERIIQYLTDHYSVNINAVFFNVFELNNQKLIGRSFLRDPGVIEEQSAKTKRAAWTGYYFVNTGIQFNDARDWALNVEYNYISAGGGPRWINAIKKLKPGDKIFAYIKGCGYVGFGTVTASAVPVGEFEIDGVLFVGSLPDDHIWKDQKADEISGEWLVKVQWHRTFDANNAKWINNGFANQNVVCKLRDERTFDFLKKEFDVESLKNVDGCSN